ncbi:hypothetical protein ACGFNU_49695 [Spirillospora sp. NPDC048911]|uniref:hypothetical protein n=1 Tax=Spirillospora sp. NPDC048911 TaxID=3364527 RepID=UPI0037142614
MESEVPSQQDTARLRRTAAKVGAAAVLGVVVLGVAQSGLHVGDPDLAGLCSISLGFSEFRNAWRTNSFSALRNRAHE